MVESKRPLILVVDDDPALLRMIETILAQTGYEVISTDNGEDALLKTAERPPDLVILDVNMPGMGSCWM